MGTSDPERDEWQDEEGEDKEGEENRREGESEEIDMVGGKGQKKDRERGKHEQLAQPQMQPEAAEGPPDQRRRLRDGPRLKPNFHRRKIEQKKGRRT